MAAATVKKTQIKFNLDTGKSSIVNLPEPINDTLTDPDTGDTLIQDVYTTARNAFASDIGETVSSIDVAVITTTTNSIITSYNRN